MAGLDKFDRDMDTRKKADTLFVKSRPLIPKLEAKQSSFESNSFGNSKNLYEEVKDISLEPVDSPLN
jgi:hypothetical protein